MRLAIALLFTLTACKSAYSSADEPADAGQPGAEDASVASEGGLPGSVDAAPAAGCPSAGHACVADAPDGWNGPLFVYDGDVDQVPDCPAAMNIARIDAHRGFHDPTTASSCTACSCLPVQGATCLAQLRAGATDCGTLTNATPLGATCATIGPGQGYEIPMVGTGGACPPSGGVPKLAPIPWDGAIRACGADGLLRTGCADGEICAPEPASPFRAKLCVMKKGDVDCPGGGYGTKTLANGLNDTRGCTACACNPPTSIACQGQAVLYTGASDCLNGIPKFVTLPQTSCSANGSTNAGMRLANAFATGGSCTPAGDATPTGTVTAGDPITVCCAN